MNNPNEEHQQTTSLTPWLVGAIIVLSLGVVTLGWMAFGGGSDQVVEEGTTQVVETEITDDSSTSCSYVLEWDDAGLNKAVEELVYNVTDVLVVDDETVLATYTDDEGNGYVAKWSEGDWERTALDGVSNPRAIRMLSNGTFLLGVSAKADEPILYRSDDGLTWMAVAEEELPNTVSTTVWDLIELEDGSVLVATDNPENNPDRENPALYLLEGARLTELASFPGLGVLSLEVLQDGTIVVATEESDEHDDAESAGQAHIFLSKDTGRTWNEGEIPEGANRIYDLMEHSSGLLYAGSGIRGELLVSEDGGMTWEQVTHVPTSERPFGKDGVRTVEMSRVYQLLELCDGALLVGTGNNGGEVFYSDDGGQSWQETGMTGNNNVVWGLAQAPDGTIWIGTGSRGGDVWKSN